MNSEKAFFTIAELAAHYRVHYQTIRKYLKKGLIHAIKIDKEYRIPASELIRIADENFEKMKYSRNKGD